MVEAMELIEDDGITGATDDDDDDNPSSPGSAYDEGTNLINVAMENEVTAQLVAAGVVGVAAAAAITSSKKKKRPHSFETNPSIRKRQQNRLLRKLRVSVVAYIIYILHTLHHSEKKIRQILFREQTKITKSQIGNIKRFFLLLYRNICYQYRIFYMCNKKIF